MKFLLPAHICPPFWIPFYTDQGKRILKRNYSNSLKLVIRFVIKTNFATKCPSSPKLTPPLTLDISYDWNTPRPRWKTILQTSGDVIH